MKVYAISNGTQVKVGRSGAPRGRLGSLQTASPTALHLCCEADCGSSLMAAAVERFAHELLADRRAAGEWFDVSPSQAEAAIDAAIKMIEQGRERETKTVPFSMRLDPDLKEGLQKLADADRRNLTNFIEVKLREIISDQTPVKSVYVTASQSRTKIGITSRCCAKRAAEISRSIGSPVVLVYSLESARGALNRNSVTLHAATISSAWGMVQRHVRRCQIRRQTSSKADTGWRLFHHWRRVGLAIRIAEAAVH